MKPDQEIFGVSHIQIPMLNKYEKQVWSAPHWEGRDPENRFMQDWYNGESVLLWVCQPRLAGMWCDHWLCNEWDSPMWPRR